MFMATILYLWKICNTCFRIENALCKVGYPNKRYPPWTFFLQCLTRASEHLFANMLPRYAHGVCEVMLVIKTMACLPSPSPSRPTWPTRQATWTPAENAYAHAPPTTLPPQSRTPTPHYSTCNLGLQTSCRSCCGCVFSSILKYLTAAIAALCARPGPVLGMCDEAGWRLFAFEAIVKKRGV